VLDETADEAQDVSVTRIIIVGYEGGAASQTNRALTASARAYAVQQGLLKRGVDPDRLYAMASAAHPEADEAAPAFIADRRAEIIIQRGTPGF
jgi:outer membrane protein OmpA-like peptidoglycan-associated protein